jgi:putative ABC transport system permease protein
VDFVDTADSAAAGRALGIVGLFVIPIVGALIGFVLGVYLAERTRELGLLRAVGMDRGQVRAAVRYEAVMVSLFGTLTGLAAGIGAGVALMWALRSQGFDHLMVPATPLLAVLVFGAIAGVLCATIPARRASRVDVLQALYAD